MCFSLLLPCLDRKVMQSIVQPVECVPSIPFTYKSFSHLLAETTHERKLIGGVAKEEDKRQILDLSVEINNP